MADEATKVFYDAVAARYAQLLPDTAVESAVDLAMVAQFVDELGEGAEVLDAGCGTGRMIAHLHSLSSALSVTGLDVSPQMLREARVAHPQSRLVEGALEALPFADVEFGGVLAWYSIIHTPPHELHRVLGEFHRVLRPGGVALLAYQAGTGERSTSGAYGVDVELHAFLHHSPYVAAALEAAGLHPIAVLDRDARRGERHGQGFVLARRA
ncbi:class I SAM-dependent methyltransferase [Glycomyces sp. YM15]|uniref:class I SAM-dependent methyltransferase n=1 Tax=Glycomyces sp. YM15 TaxID=2800446 RepID=UPI001963ABDB|nr:class I SAM-dependent methyltransferase [Glycomyces sp. YM15]